VAAIAVGLLLFPLVPLVARLSRKDAATIPRGASGSFRSVDPMGCDAALSRRAYAQVWATLLLFGGGILEAPSGISPIFLRQAN
jgi:hypothetical protein